ncbi:MAG TPA: hypothetical protein PK954_21090, partial [Anaerolineales bacterium]|nr:hypothetical protein [Anaerolineales bacterium]
IVLPQMGPPLASLGIFTFMGTWNDYLWPLIVLTSPENRTIPLLLVWFRFNELPFPAEAADAFSYHELGAI